MVVEIFVKKESLKNINGNTLLDIAKEDIIILLDVRKGYLECHAYKNAVENIVRKLNKKYYFPSSMFDCIWSFAYCKMIHINFESIVEECKAVRNRKRSINKKGRKSICNLGTRKKNSREWKY